MTYKIPSSFSIEPETIKKLNELSLKLDVTKSKIVNDLLVELLKETNADKVENLLKKGIEKLQL